MSFSFGAPKPAAGPAPAAPAFSFGGAAPAPATAAGATSSAPAPAFSFGGAAPTPAAAPAPAAASLAPAPATGFSFGGGAPAPAAASNAPAPSTGFSSAGAAPAPALATTNTFGGGALSAGATSTAITTATTLTAPDFDDTFKNLDVWNRTRKLCAETSTQQTQTATGAMSLAGQELMHFLSTRATTALKPQVVEWTPPNNGLRQQLGQKPVVGLSGGTTTTLTMKTLEQIGLLATELRISEAQAITLYAQVSRDYDVLSGLLTSNTADGGGDGFIDRALPDAEYDNVTKLARDFYFYERRLKLQTILYLVELRLHNNPDVIRATDTLLQEGQLVTNLITVIRDYTQRIQQLQQEIKSNIPSATQNSTAAMGGTGFMGGSQQPPQQPPKTSNFAKVHLLFCTEERQTAAEALVFIAYHTQLEVNEVSALIDLIRDLSTGLPKLSPFKDAPSPYDSSSTAMDGMNESYQQFGGASSWPPTATNASYNQYPWERKDKNSLDWQKELIRETCKTGRPKLLQCTSLLIVAAMAAMDSRQVLYDRKLHGPNDFGQGNQLLHPTQPSLENIKELHTRLKPEAHGQWARPDIWGLLACSYALLLRLTPMAIMSPTKGGSNSSFSKEVRDAARYCIEVPTELMSFTFCRLTLIPSLEKIQSASVRTICNVSEFCLSVVSEVYSLYLSILSEGNGNLPISRRMWQDREEEDLKLKIQQYNDKLQFDAFLGESSKREKVPKVIDLMERQECLDDLIALATALCSLGPNYARHFWARDKETEEFIPSRALRECIILASEDDSLIPYVYSWMAALSNDEKSAKAVNRLMTSNKNNDTIAEGATVAFTSWRTVIHNLRFYVQHLSINNDMNVTKPSSPGTTASANQNTSYYYNLEGDAMRDSSRDPRSRGGKKSSSSSSSKNSMKPKELSEGSKLRVASYLALIMNVSLHCFDARHSILSTSLPLTDGDIAAGGDECLVILFKLAIAPLPPQMRGATLSTIASLLRSTEGIEDPKVKAFMEEQGNNAWEYLESCSLLPIYLLDRYRVIKPTGADAQNQAALTFPPSSMALAGLPNRTKSSFPKHPMYGVLYEMDNIESKNGWYPSTEGFLDLLNSLVSSVGCPSKLGQNWRLRTGCTPYLEYVINFVLPKALGVNSQQELPFRVPGDRSRLVSRALAVVESVVIRYNLPPQPALKSMKDQVSQVSTEKVSQVSTPLSVLGIQTVIDQVYAESKQQELQELKNDFRSMTVSSTLHAPNQQYGLNNSTMDPVSDQAIVGSSSVSTVPVPKSPGFTILVELLSSSCGVLLQVLNAVLTECGGRNGILSVFRDQSINMDMTYALFGATPPDLNSAKEGIKEDGPTKPLQNLLKPFFPKFQTSNIDDHFVDNSVLWRETSIASALHILCAAATREENFIATLMAAKEQPLKYVPVIEFQELKPGSGSALAIDKKAKDVRVSPLSDLLFSITGSRHLRSSIVEYIGYDSVAKENSTEIPAAALSLVYRMQQRISPPMSLHSLCGNEYTTSGFSKSIADRLRLSSRNSDRIRDSEVLTLILNWILTELRSCTIVNDGLAQVLLGLPGDTSDGNWKPGCGHYSGAINDCFDAILDILGHNELSSGFSGISSLCFEVVFRLQDLIKAKDEKSLKVAIYTAERLRDVDFWEENVSRIPYVDVAQMDQNQYVQHLHSTAWLLKGLACELRLLVGFGGDTISASQFGRYLEQHPNQCNYLLSTLYGSDEGVIYNLVENLPLELVSMDPSLRHPSQEALIAGVIDLPGARDIVEGYRILDSKKVLSFMGATHESLEDEDVKQWIDQWNFIAGRNCAVSHLTGAMTVLINASLFSVESMSRCHTPLSQSSNFSHSWLHNNGSRDLLAFFLQRLEDIPEASDYQGMDKFLVPVATKNLSTIVLTLSEFITSPSNGGVMNSSDILQLAALVARTIPSSSIGSDSADEAPFRHERTAALGSALSQLLRSSASLEPEFVSQYREEFIRAAQNLSGISGFKVDSRSNDPHGIVSMLARGCVSSIVLALSEVESESGLEKSSICSCITQTFLEQSISLVAELDEDICNFLHAIALQPSGAKMLIDAGVGRALLSAARQYIEQEKAVIQNLEGSSSSFTKTTIRTPGFLLSHLKLICALLVTANEPEDMAYSFASDSIEIIGTYGGIIHRLCYNFPVQADFLRWFLKALVAASSVVKPLKRKIQINKVEHTTKELISRAKFLDNGIVMLLEQLSENPLPRDMLPARMPRELKNSHASVGINIVNVEKDDSATWWDVLQNILTSRQDGSQSCTFPAPVSDKIFIPSYSQKWSEDTFEYSIVAADTLCLGLQLLKRVERSDLFSGSSLASGLFRCVFAAKSVDDRLEIVRFRTMHSGHSMETGDNFGNMELELEYLKMLASSLAQCVEQLLMLCLQVCDSKENQNLHVVKPIVVAIESSGIDSISLSALSEERSEFIRILCDEIKKLCKGN